MYTLLANNDKLLNTLFKSNTFIQAIRSSRSAILKSLYFSGENAVPHATSKIKRILKCFEMHLILYTLNKLVEHPFSLLLYQEVAHSVFQSRFWGDSTACIHRKVFHKFYYRYLSHIGYIINVLMQTKFSTFRILQYRNILKPLILPVVKRTIYILQSFRICL